MLFDIRIWLMMRFGAKYVTLIDNDSERNIRRVWFRGGSAFAKRWHYLTGTNADVQLLDNGVYFSHFATYVAKWEKYTPFASRQTIQGL